MPKSEDEIRTDLGQRAAGRCINCYSKLVGYYVRGPGWNWATSDLGPFCDNCFKEVKQFATEYAKEK